MKFRFILQDRMMLEELMSLRYDYKATHTRTIDQVFEDKKYICYDYTNIFYDWFALNRHLESTCYFMYENKTNNTHTVIQVEDAFLDNPGGILYTPSNITLRDVVEKFANLYNVSVKDNVFVCKYIPKNESVSIEEFCNKMFNQEEIIL